LNAEIHDILDWKHFVVVVMMMMIIIIICRVPGQQTL
jgi:hypothetical protein